MMRFFLIANPENRRASLFQAALVRLGHPPAVVIAYQSLLESQWELLDLVGAGDVVRIEAPGENAEVERALVRRGGALRGGEAIDIEIEHGRIDQPQQWFDGYCSLLEEITHRVTGRGARWMNDPADIPVLFDKTRCSKRLEAAGLPVPQRLGPIEDYRALRQRMRETSIRRVFVKLRSSSSASGVVALQAGGDRVSATTSVEMVRRGGSLALFNSLRVRRYTSESDVADLIDALCRFGVHVEQWIPKAGWRGRTFDLRIVVIGGEARHTVMRTSNGPLTNLHLGNRRGDLAEFLIGADANAIADARESCRRVSDVFPDSLYFGVDLMFTPGLRRHYLLEVNAFGDLLPGIVSGGEDTYTAEIRACSQRALSHSLHVVAR